MDETRLRAILSRFGAARALVVGDFFLDRYLVIAPALAEVSLETGRTAHQVTEVAATPGAAGTITSNLRALGVQVTALGIVGDDGEGYELRQGLRATGVDDSALIVAPGRRTPTYTKPIVRAPGGAVDELERLDIRTRAPTPAHIADELIDRLAARIPEAGVVIVADQMPEPEHGAITTRVRTALAGLAGRNAGTWFLADSRERIGAFRSVIVKPNLRECVRAVFPGHTGEPDRELAQQAGAQLERRTGRPVIVTLGGDGMLVIAEGRATHVPAVPVAGPIDVVGAGDSAASAIAAALCAGASLAEAALLGNLAAAVTIQQLGTTGTATPEQILGQWRTE
jgi:rfaE bifunctional protein kinase chain/domain